MDAGEGNANSTETEETEIPSKETLLDELTGLRLTPSEHQRIKDLVHGELLDEIKRYERRYLVVGAGGETDTERRRMLVYDMLNDRTDPPAVAMRLEDLELTSDEITLWTRVFDILCGMSTQIVTGIEDFDGGYVWELGLLFAPSYRDKTWVLKRTYPDPETERSRYANGMAASHIAVLLTGDRAFEWNNTTELQNKVTEIP